MFNCYSEPGTVIKFSSNPPLPDKRVMVPLVVDDVVTDAVNVVPNDHKGLNYGVVYDPNTMSLRAKLNFGISLQRVPNVSLDDFSSAARKLSFLESQITSRISSMEEQVRQENEEIKS